MPLIMLGIQDSNSDRGSVPNYETFANIESTRQTTESSKQTLASSWLLFLVCSCSVGAHFGKHAFSGIITLVLSSLDISTQQYGWLYSVQDFPGIFLPLFAGYLTLFVEPAIAVFLFSLVVFGGQAISIVGIFFKSFFLTLAGKALFGFGDGALSVIQGVIVAKHFKISVSNEEGRNKMIGLSTAYGSMLAISRFTTMASVSLPPFIAQHKSWGGYFMALLLSVGVSGFSVFCSLIYMLIEIRRRAGSHDDRIPVAFKFHRVTSNIVYIVVIWVLVSSCVFGFLHFSSDIFVSEFHVSIQAAALLNAVVTLCACIFSPLLGQMQDRLGHPLWFLFFSCLLLFFAMTAFWGLSEISYSVSSFWVLFLPCLCLGVAFAMAPVLLLSCLVSFINHQVF